MITGLSHVTLFVRDQDSAKAFYAEKLGFEVRTDMTLGDFRWLTVAPKGQAAPEIVLIRPYAGPMMPQAVADALLGLLDQGALGCGVFETTDCRATHAELSARGVEFVSPPTERPYGIEAIFRDNQGNWFSLTERATACAAS